MLGQDPDPLLGTWHLNLSESKFVSGPSAYKRVITKIERQADGLKVTYDMVGVRGGVTHWEWTGRLDGKDYALQGVEDVITNAYSQTGDRTYSVTAKLDGRVTTSTEIVISPDGKVMTVTSGGNTAIYTKQ